MKGAALDVLENEDFIIHDDIILKSQDIPIDYAMNTIINARLMQMKNVLITPHIAFNSVDAVHRILHTTLENINHFCGGQVQNSVLKKIGGFMQYAPDLTQLIGHTPLVRINKLNAGPAELYAKLEMFNPYSVKDRPRAGYAASRRKKRPAA